MSRKIPKKKQKKLLRLISARADIDYAEIAYKQFKALNSSDIRYSLFLAMIVAYCRPFTANEGLGKLDVELPGWPDIALPQAGMRHERMMILRNNFLSHSCIEGSKVIVLGRGAIDPDTGEPVSKLVYKVAKLEFLREEFADWFYELIVALRDRLDGLINAEMAEIDRRYVKDGEEQWLDTAEFDWMKKQRNAQPGGKTKCFLCRWISSFCGR
jgi:hypothetical protein